MTPDPSQSPAPKSVAEEDTVVSVSSVFYPGGNEAGFDTIFRSQDTVLFYVHSSIYLGACKNAFKSLISSLSTQPPSPDEPIDVPETSDVLNVILHTLYNKSCANNSPTFDTLETAVNRMPHYDILPGRLIMPSTPLHDILLSHAPIQAMRLYCLAACHDLYVLASSTSSHLLSFPISSITDDLARKMGALYLKRLVLLHTERLEALKRIIRDPPHPHPPTMLCDFDEQKKLSRAWSLVAGYLVWDCRPDLSVQTVQTSFGSLGDHLTCTECLMTLQSRIKNVVVQWVTVKRTI
ncbi:hypothetical protein BDQ17DRAFT_1360747 [Cyathus striatus]|nr:hypothetical protein BDQ17DRAFT_1360747 [Cyathus striatus]